MSEETTGSKLEFKNHGWRVTFAGMGINLALGILYTWSVISKHVPDEWGWSENDKSLPYMVACLIFSLVMVPAGRMQDKIGPRRVATIGGVLVGLGFVLASMTSSLAVFVIGFGVLAGAGIGFGYASATPPAVNGLASVYAAPLSRWLIISCGFKTAILILGIGFLIVVVSLAQLIKPPHKTAAQGSSVYRGIRGGRTPETASHGPRKSRGRRKRTSREQKRGVRSQRNGAHGAILPALVYVCVRSRGRLDDYFEARSNCQDTGGH
ncbi:MAG: MFS transporter [Planctomycetota bacterium]|jgi:hypothetical protein